MKVFVPVSETLMQRLGLGPDDLVPYHLEYEVVRVDVADELDEPLRNDVTTAEIS